MSEIWSTKLDLSLSILIRDWFCPQGINIKLLFYQEATREEAHAIAVLEKRSCTKVFQNNEHHIPQLAVNA